MLSNPNIEHLSSRFRDLLVELQEVSEAAERCSTRVHWAAERSVPVTPTILFDFDVLYPLFEVERPRYESSAYKTKRLYRDGLTRAAVTRFIEDPKASNILLPHGARVELQRFLQAYAKRNSIRSRTISSLENEITKQSDPWSFKNIIFPENELNLGLIAGELLEYSNARPITRILDALSRKSQATSEETISLDLDPKFRDNVFEFLSKWRGQRRLSNAVDAQNIAETVSLFQRTALSQESQSPPLLISTSPIIHRMGKQLVDFSPGQFHDYPILDNSLDLITLVQKRFLPKID